MAKVKFNKNGVPIRIDFSREHAESMIVVWKNEDGRFASTSSIDLTDMPQMLMKMRQISREIEEYYNLKVTIRKEEKAEPDYIG